MQALKRPAIGEKRKKKEQVHPRNTMVQAIRLAATHSRTSERMFTRVLEYLYIYLKLSQCQVVMVSRIK